MSGRVFHGPLINSHSRFQLAGVVQRTGHSANDVYPDVQVYSSLEEGLNTLKPELVIVNTPPFLHEQEALQALAAGCHVVIEKPFATSVESADKILNTALKAGLIVTAFQNRRWDSDFITLRYALAFADLGKISAFESHFDRFRPEVDLSSWKEQAHPGAGLVWNLGPHLADQAVLLFGMPDWVKATVRKQRENAQVDDYFNIQLGYPSFIAELKASYLVPNNKLKYVVHASNSSYIKMGIDIQENQLQKGYTPLDHGYGIEPQSQTSKIYSPDMKEANYNPVSGNYHTFYDLLAEAIQSGKPAPVKPQEIRDVIEILEAVYKSSKEDRTLFFRNSTGKA